ncbi:hypothetical protein K491DRAFT_676998 [Lophiostoma macrostomum CBS 122681]|uniref:Protein YAE1 n=1 Tax=Lophiostoma macrostomum CBS 122681 TaxID=1314788 RepID=A0A6A6TFF3_9PLEO|nr:hypothetical protein K491DRAFT_676998 [Lophiostoma macrostomum CBS 122681]
MIKALALTMLLSLIANRDADAMPLDVHTTPSSTATPLPTAAASQSSTWPRPDFTSFDFWKGFIGMQVALQVLDCLRKRWSYKKAYEKGGDEGYERGYERGYEDGCKNAYKD